MLSWEKGPKPEDGTWGKYFYARLWETTGFEPYRPATETLPPDLEEVARECDGWYERLATYAIGRGTPDG